MYSVPLRWTATRDRDRAQGDNANGEDFGVVERVAERGDGRREEYGRRKRRRRYTTD